MNTPLRFQPYLRPMVWGGRRLGDVLGKALPAVGRFGEAWEISDHGTHHSRLLEPAADESGLTLRNLLGREPDALLGARSSRRWEERSSPVFPWLVKFLDANGWLSVQVHPDEHKVRALRPGEGGKTESWLVLAAEPDSKVYAGLRPGVGERELRAALAVSLEHTAEAVAGCLHTVTPRPGDCFFLPAGTVHAVGGGVLLAEVQQTSDATFRLFDWGRSACESASPSRALHIEEALACIDWQAGPVVPVPAQGYPRPGEDAPTEPVRQPLVRCRHFHLDYVRQVRPFPCGGVDLLQALIVVHGRGSLRSDSKFEPLNTGETVLLPACMPEVWCHPEGPLGVLLVTLPAQEETTGQANGSVFETASRPCLPRAG